MTTEDKPAGPTPQEHAEALREDWARRKVAAAGKSWATHLMKFGGAVVRR